MLTAALQFFYIQVNSIFSHVNSFINAVAISNAAGQGRNGNRIATLIFFMQ